MSKNVKPAYGSGRERIMVAVTEVAFARGLQGVTFRSVAEAAAVPNSLIAYHFSTRKGLLEKTLEWSLGEAIRVSELSAFLDRPDKFIGALMDLLADRLPILVFQYQLILESQRRPDIASSVQGMYDAYVGDLVAAMQTKRTDSLFTEESARYIFASIDGLVLQFVAGVPREVIEKTLRAFWRNQVSTLLS